VRILIAPNSFKESLDSIEITKHVARGLRKASRKFCITGIPLADGGTCTARIVTNALQGTIAKKIVTGPEGKPVQARYGIMTDTGSAVIEHAEIAGIQKVTQINRNPLKTTTLGIGELILSLAARNIKKIILGVGDSATIDCGVGAMSALGVRFHDKKAADIDPNCKGLLRLKKIDASNVFQPVRNMRLVVAADVQNKLTGKNGAIMFARQKGAKPGMMPLIRKALDIFRKIILNDYGVDLNTVPGAGAAGGIAGGLKAILGADIVSGFDMIKELTGLEQAVQTNDVVITGEGRIDRQTFYGKTTMKVLALCHQHKKPVILIAGSASRRETGKLNEYGVIKTYYLTKSSKKRILSSKDTATSLTVLAHRIGKNLLSIRV
jgi:glycerate kinase